MCFTVAVSVAVTVAVAVAVLWPCSVPRLLGAWVSAAVGTCHCAAAACQPGAERTVFDADIVVPSIDPAVPDGERTVKGQSMGNERQ